MRKTKRKVITKKVTVNLKDKEKEFFYSRGIQDALHTVLTQHKDLIQLKDLCTEYEKLFKYPHPTREWHLFRKTNPTTQEVGNTNNGDGTEGATANNNVDEQAQDIKEVQLPEQETNPVPTSQETTS